MDNAGTFAIATPQIGAAMTQKIISPIVGLNGMSGVTLTMNFKFGSGSGTVTPIVATSLDGGTVWYQIARWDLTNASVLKWCNIAAVPAGITVPEPEPNLKFIVRVTPDIPFRPTIGEIIFCVIAAPICGVAMAKVPALSISNRSEERRVGKECRSRWSPYH